MNKITKSNNIRTVKFLFILVLLLLVFASPSPVMAEERREEINPSEMQKPPSPAMEIIKNFKYDPITWSVPRVGKDVERVQLKNGMILYLKEDHTLPLVSIHCIIRTGNIYETPQEQGLAELTGHVMRMGGTEKLTPHQLNEELEFIGARVETSIAGESGSAYMQVISRKLDYSMDLYSQVLRHPRFDEKQLNLAKSDIKERIRRENDDISAIGRREFYNIVYPHHPRGWGDNWDIVKNFKKEDLIKWHQRFYKPNNMMLAVVGDFNREDLLKKFDKYFGDWTPDKTPLPDRNKVRYQFNPGIYYAEKTANQAYIRMGHLGVKQDNPDIYALTLMDYILGGGGFSSMFMETVRSDKGLAYMVYSYFETETPDYGTTGAVSQTKSESVIEAYLTMIEQINKIRNQKVGNEKLQWAKNTLINSYLMGFQKPEQQVFKLMLLEYDGMPADFYQTYCDNLKKVSQDDILRVAQKYLHPDKMTVIFVGEIKGLDKLKDKINKIQLKDFKDEEEDKKEEP